MTKKPPVERPAPISLPADSPTDEETAPLDRPTELRTLYKALKGQLQGAKGSGAAAIGRELRILTRELEQIEQTEVSKADELAARRTTKAGAARPPSRRRKSK